MDIPRSFFMVKWVNVCPLTGYAFRMSSASAPYAAIYSGHSTSMRVRYPPAE